MTLLTCIQLAIPSNPQALGGGAAAQPHAPFSVCASERFLLHAGLCMRPTNGLMLTGNLPQLLKLFHEAGFLTRRHPSKDGAVQQELGRERSQTFHSTF